MGMRVELERGTGVRIEGGAGEENWRGELE